MATIQDLGKVAYFNKGVYNSETTYEINDVVSYNGSSYVSLGNNNLGNLPTNTAFWSIVASKGDKGDTGKAFVIEKTYASIEDMVDDYDNMNVDDYVMIQGSIEDEENATLWTKTDTEVSPYKWVYLADFSGASGITGATPNIQIGTVTEGNQPSVTRRAGSTNENPILDFVLKTGAKGDTGATGNGISGVAKTSTSGLTDTYTISYTSGNSSTFDVHNGKGISSIAKTTSVGLVDTYTITYNDGTTSTFDITNGEDGSVTQEQLDETNEEVERVNMVYNALPKVSGESTELSLNNTAECPVYEIGLRPSALEQETTTGKNLVNVVETNQIIYSNGYSNFTLSNGVITTTGNTLVGYKVKVNPNTQYTAQLFGTLTEGTNALRIREYSAKPTSWETNHIKQTNKTIENNSKTSSSITTSATTEWILFVIFSNTSGLVCRDMQLELGDTATNYEEYTGGQPSPNPQYPQQIHVVSGDNSVRISNKNLFDINWLSGTNITITNGTARGTAGSFYTNFSTDNNGIPNTNYGNKQISISVSAYCEGTTSNNNGLRFVVNYTDGTSDDIQFIDNETTKTTKTLVTNSNKEIKNITMSYGNSSGKVWNISEVMIVDGSTVQSFEPYTSQTYPLTLGNLEYCKIGDYEDLFFKNVVGNTYYDSTLELNKWYLKKNIPKITFDGSEGWGYNTSATTPTNRTVISKSFTIPIGTNYISNRFVYQSTTSNKLIIQSNGTIYISIEDAITGVESTDTDNEKVQKIVTYISNNNIDLYYPLSSTNILLNNTLQTQLDNLSNAISYSQQTNVSQTNDDLPVVIKMSAIRDMSGIFELIQE